MDVVVNETVPPNAADEDTNVSLPKACPICATAFDKIVPKLLPCLHSFCQPCLEGKLKEQGEEAKTATTAAGSSRLKCPKCGQEFLVPNNGITSLIDNQFILENVAKPSGDNDTESHVCTSCEDNSSSTSYCLNCTEWLCDACVQAHQRVRVTKDHEIKAKEELKASLRKQGRAERSLYCQRHPCEKLTLFCANCERLTCRDCQLHQHKDHKYQFVNEAAGRYREYFRKRLAVLGEKMGPLAESIEAVENSTKHLDHKAEVVTNEIKVSSSEIIKAVKQRETVLLNELNALVHFKRKMLTKQTKDLHLMEEILKHNFEFAKHAVMEGSDVSLLYSKRQLGSRIQNLLSLKYHVTPVAHSDLKFVTESVKLCNSILKAGAVMTPSTQSGQRVSASTANNRNRSIPHHHQNGPQSKGNPLNSLNAFSNRQMGGVFSPRIPTNTHKPSSKVYPNVVSSHMQGLANGINSSGMSFMASNNILSQQLGVLPNLLSSTGGSIPPGLIQSTGGYHTSSSFHGSSTPARKPQPDGAVIPLHHIENSRKVRESAPSYDKGIMNTTRTSSSSSPSGIIENSSHRNSPLPENVLNSLLQHKKRDNMPSADHANISSGRDGNMSHTVKHLPVAQGRDGILTTTLGVNQPVVEPPRDTCSTMATSVEQPSMVLSNNSSLSTTHGMEPAALPPTSSPKFNQPSPKPSASPLPSSCIPKHSPNSSQTSLSPPHVSPHPQPSPKSMSPSPLPSPLPTFLDPEMQNSLSGGVRIKMEKNNSPPSFAQPCSLVKEEARHFSSCGRSSSGQNFHEPSTYGPPSNNSSNEDWCAVCHNGGELLCCDTCPKVFHLLCHVPTLPSLPSDAWSCGLCEGFDIPRPKLSDIFTSGHKRRPPITGMSERDTKVCEKILLELFCHPDSVPFHEKVSKSVPNYYKIIQKPMDLTSIKAKLQPMHFEHYGVIQEFIDDCKLIFTNCALFNDTDSEVGRMGKRLARDFQGIVRKYLPNYKEPDNEPKPKKRREDI